MVSIEAEALFSQTDFCCFDAAMAPTFQLSALILHTKRCFSICIFLMRLTFAGSLRFMVGTKFRKMWLQSVRDDCKKEGQQHVALKIPYSFSACGWLTKDWFIDRLVGSLLEFYILVTSKVISGRVLTCASAHSWWFYSDDPLERLNRQHHDSISRLVSISWHRANQSLPYPLNAEDLAM